MSTHRGFTVAGKIARHALVACATTSLIASTALTPIASAFAQAPQAQAATPQVQNGDSARPAPGPPITAQTTANDPPARVGRIAKIDGTVSFHTADEDQWNPATLNYPLTTGNALWTEPGARAELQIGSGNRLVMDSGTELNVTVLDDRRFEAGLPQGTAYLSVSDMAPGDSYAIQTPRGLVQITEPGRYVIAAGDDETPSSVTAIEGGTARLTGRAPNQTVPAGQTATITGPMDGDEPVKTALAPMQQNSFAQSVLAEEKAAAPAQAMAAAPGMSSAPAVTSAPTVRQAAPARAPVAMPAQVQGMTGAQDMAAYGSWSTAPDYGSVWYPPVDAGWVPYRHGHWAYIQPWGWTWVADEPWGFAPFHYGRWVMVHDRWAWSPGYHHKHHRHYRPVYAPALVAFFGTGSGLSISITAGNVGWVPLGWHEPYYPPYRVSRTYIRNVNVTHVTNITRVTNVTNVNNVTVNRYVNRNSATVVPADAMRRSQSVPRAMQTVDRRQIDNARIDRRVQVQPTAATAGISPQTARRMGIQGDDRAARRTAPGPEIRQNDLRQTTQRGGEPRHDTRMQSPQPPRQDMRNATTAPAPRQMSRDQAAQPQNARQFDAQQQRAAQQRNQDVTRNAAQPRPQGSRTDERPQAQPRQQVQTEALPQQQRAVQEQRQNAERQQQAAQRQQQERQQQERQRQDLVHQQSQRQEMQRQMQQQAEQQHRQRQQESQRQQQESQQRSQNAQRQQEQAQQQQRAAQPQQREMQQRQYEVQQQRSQDTRRQQEAEDTRQRQRRDLN